MAKARKTTKVDELSVIKAVQTVIDKLTKQAKEFDLSNADIVEGFKDLARFDLEIEMQAALTKFIAACGRAEGKIRNR